MIRDFTNDTKESLKKEIDKIDKENWGWFSDKICDGFMYVGKWIGIIDLSDDMSNVDSYHKKILDMTNMTKSDIEKVFDDVRIVEQEFAGLFEDINEHMGIYCNILSYLSEAIQPNFIISSPDTIRKSISEYKRQLAVYDNRINNKYKIELDWAAREGAKLTFRGTLKSTVSFVVDLACLPVSLAKDVLTGNPVGLFTDTWDLVDDVFAFGSNLTGLTVLGIGVVISHFNGSDETKHMAIKYAEAYGGASGLTDALKAEEEINGSNEVLTFMRTASEYIDIANSAGKLYSFSKGLLESLKNPKKTFDSLFDTKFGFGGNVTLKKADMLDKYKDNYRHYIPLVKRLGKESHYKTLKNIKNAYNFADSLFDYMSDSTKDTATENLIKKTIGTVIKPIKKLEDAHKLGEKLVEPLSTYLNDRTVRDKVNNVLDTYAYTTTPVSPSYYFLTKVRGAIFNAYDSYTGTEGEN